LQQFQTITEQSSNFPDFKLFSRRNKNNYRKIFMQPLASLVKWVSPFCVVVAVCSVASPAQAGFVETLEQSWEKIKATYPSQSTAPRSSTFCVFEDSNSKQLDRGCQVTSVGSLNPKYNGAQTGLPDHIDIVWSDGVKSKIIFTGLLSVEKSQVSGTVTIDGFSYFFMHDINGLGFRRLDSNLQNKSIFLSKM
jgi:hypothetical protein